MSLVAQHPDDSADNPDGDTITGVVGPMKLVDDVMADDDDHDDEDDDGHYKGKKKDD
jgi:hypothetical protein